ALREVVERYKQLVKSKSGRDFPQEPSEQLKMARDAVFRSWMNARAIEYRRIYDIPDHIGTAVNVQMMVFGNTGDRSATGVGFTRNPATGAREFYGEFLINAQGEDVVAGIRTPQPIGELGQVKHVILVRRETVPDDIHGMFVAQGILTATGGMTSHAAVVGRQMGKPSVVGAGGLEIHEHAKQFRVSGQTVKEGDFISFDGL